MSFTYHLVTANRNPGRYYRISGTAAAPVVEADVAIGAGTGEWLDIFSTDGGTTLYVGGLTPLLFYKSTDGGATWASKSFAGVDYVKAIAGFDGDDSVVVGCENTFGAGSGWYKLNTTTGLMEYKQASIAAGVNSIWAIPGTDTAPGIGTIIGIDINDPGNRCIWYSTDRGVTWTHDVATTPGWQGIHCVRTDPRDNLIWYLCNGGGADLKLRKGYLGAGLTYVATVVGAGTANRYPNVLGVDETGAVWFIGYTDHVIYRRDPTTGVIAASKATAGVIGGLWVIDSQNILASAGNYLYFWDGSIWHTYHTNFDLGLPTATCRGIWGEPIGVENAGGDLAGGPRFRIGYDPERNSGPRQQDGSLQGDMQIVTGVQNIATFDGGTLED